MPRAWGADSGLVKEHPMRRVVAVIPAFAVGMQSDDGVNEYSGLGRFEQSPFPTIEGSGFAAGRARDDPAPTIMRHLRVPADGINESPLQTGL